MSFTVAASLASAVPPSDVTGFCSSAGKRASQFTVACSRPRCGSSWDAKLSCTSGESVLSAPESVTRPRRRFSLKAQAVSEEAPETEIKDVEEEAGDTEVPVESSSPPSPSPSDFPSASASPDALISWLKEAAGNEPDAIQQFTSYVSSLEKEKDYLGQQVASLTEEVNLSKDRFLRLNADFENFRKRAEKEKVNMASSVTGSVLEKLLPMIDNFERAKSAIKAETEAEQKIDASYQGIYKQFVEVMKAQGVAAVETEGREFDPNVHEAIMREESTEYAEGVVSLEFRKGFVIGEKLLRPAMVKVSSGPGPAAAPSPAAPVSEDDILVSREASAEEPSA